jgi:hypothetical protein
MATVGKVPTLGFLGLIKYVVLLGFGSASVTIADAYVSSFFVASRDAIYVEADTDAIYLMASD